MIGQALCGVSLFVLAPCLKIVYAVRCHSKLVWQFCNLLWKSLFNLYWRDAIREIHDGDRGGFSIHIGNIQFLTIADRLTRCVFRNDRSQIKDKELTLTYRNSPGILYPGLLRYR